MRSAQINRYLAYGLLILPVGCSALPTRERYQNMNATAKAAFLAHYPNLKDTPTEEAEHRFVYGKDPAHYTINHLEITPAAPPPLREGKTLDLKATLTFKDGRRVDATSDVEWDVTPALGSIKGHSLNFECAASDLMISANFLDERTATFNLEIRKPLAALVIQLDQSSVDLNRNSDFALQMTAFCKDGSQAQVSCQTQWQSLTRGIEVSPCGKVHVTGEPPNRYQVQAKYGELTLTQTLQTPLRK